MAAVTVSRNVYMIEIGRQPRDRRMAIVTAFAARNVRFVFAGCCRSIMARAASPHYLRVVDQNGRFKHRGVMTVLADIRGLNMAEAFADGSDAVVAPYAVVGDARMIKQGRNPGCHAVTVVALIVGRNVIRCLAR